MKCVGQTDMTFAKVEFRNLLMRIWMCLFVCLRVRALLFAGVICWFAE
jgi:hypothetical protein